MGEVYGARDTKLKRDVALKISQAEMSEDPVQLARLVREAQFLDSVNHSNIAAIYGVYEIDQFTFLVLELVVGESLSIRLERGALQIPDALDIAAQIAAALETAHQSGIGYRDLKPANIMLTVDSARQSSGSASPTPGSLGSTRPSRRYKTSSVKRRFILCIWRHWALSMPWPATPTARSRSSMTCGRLPRGPTFRATRSLPSTPS